MISEIEGEKRFSLLGFWPPIISHFMIAFGPKLPIRRKRGPHETYQKIIRSFHQNQDCAKIKAGTLSINQAARDLQVAPSVISYWINQFTEEKLELKPSEREKKLEEENRELKERLGNLYNIVENLKKVADSKQRMKSADSSVITEKNLHLFLKDVKSLDSH